MGAIITGQSLGLFNSSLAALGVQGAMGQASVGQGGERVYVNASTGNLVVQGQDARQSVVGADLSALRTYNSLGNVDDGFGGDDNWRLGFLSTLSIDGDTATRVTADGATQHFTRQGGGSYVSSDGAGAHDTLRLTGGVWVYQEGSSLTRSHYENGGQGRLLALLDQFDKGQRFYYSGSPSQLTRITTDTTTGIEETLLDYYTTGASAGLLRQVRLATGSENYSAHTYTYDTQQRLHKVIVDLTPDNSADDKEYETTYAYESSSSHLLKSITQSDGRHVAFSYHPGSDKLHTVTSGSVAAVAAGDGHVTRYTYTDNTTTVSMAGQQ